MSSSPVLRLPQFDKPFVLETDACDKGIGDILLQDDHPIAYLSKAVGPKNQSRLVYEKELLTVLHAVSKWQHYLEGGHFIIRVDQRSLKYLLDQRIIFIFQQKRVINLLGLNYSIQYKQGYANRMSDTLSGREAMKGKPSFAP